MDMQGVVVTDPYLSELSWPIQQLTQNVCNPWPTWQYNPRPGLRECRLHAQF